MAAYVAEAARAEGRRRWCQAAATRLVGAEQVEAGLSGTQSFIAELFAEVKKRADAGGDLKAAYDSALTAMRPRYGNWVIFDHCMPFDVSRAYDEAKGIADPRIWTAERDIEMWKALEQQA